MEYHHRPAAVPVMEHGATGGSGPAGHWGYSGGWGAPVPAPRASKRTHSESDDCDDVFSEESSKDAQSPGGGGGGGDSCQLMSRKRRRGVIEKKRRDRINTSLTELKRLVPSAYEKQGSAKLEKAEILQLTVDHLKMLHAKGLDTLAYDPQRFAMDYHSIGFRECASEVARYLVSCEGLDIQDPLRLRLMSHLQCFAAQRELATKSCTNPWSYGSAPQSYHPHAPHPTHPTLPAATPITNPISSGNLIGNIPSSHQPSHIHDGLHSYTDISTSCPSSRLDAMPPSSSVPSTSSTSLTPLTTTATSAPSALGYPPAPSHYSHTAGVHPGYPLSGSYHHPPAPGHHQYSQNNSKPYRPWGAELAY